MSAPATPSRPPWRTYLAILVPMVLTNILQAAAGTADGIYLGQLLGVQAIAAVSAFFPVLLLMFSIMLGLSSGATVLIGQAWGAKDIRKAQQVAGTATVLAVAAGVVIAVCGAWLAPVLMQSLGTPYAILPRAIAYARLIMIGMPIIFLLWVVTSMSRGVGDAVSPLWALAIATGLSLVLTPLFIRGWLGVPKLDVASAAVSTIIAFVVALLWLFWYWRRTNHPLAPRLADIARLDVKAASAMLGIGSAIMVQMMAIAVADIAVLRLANQHGMDATAAYGAIKQIINWVQLPVLSLSITATILASHMIGAGRGAHVSSVTRAGLILNTATTGSLIVVTYLFASPILGLFITAEDVAAQATGQLHVVIWSMLLAGWAAVLTGTMRADGTVVVPTCLSVLSLFAVQIPVAYLLDGKIGLAGIWVGYAAAFTVTLTLQAAYFWFGWRRRPARILVRAT